MLPRARIASLLFLTLYFLSAAKAANSDFSGKWQLNTDHSDLSRLPGEPYPVLVVAQRANLHCTATTGSGSTVEWTLRLDGEDSKYQIGREKMNSAVKWEGAALLVNTLVSGTRDYTIADRWLLSRDGAQLNITRQITDGPRQFEGYLIYRREGAADLPPATTSTTTTTTTILEPNGPGPTMLARRPEPVVRPMPEGITIPAGTHVLLTLTNPVSTKNSKDGEHVYLQTAVPVAQDGRIVIPRGSYVQGSINKSKPAGRGSNKGELYIRFDSLTLPNGTTRDFRARLTAADSAKGKVDPDEGKISGTGKNTDAGKVGRDVGIGSMGGVIVGSAAGHPVTGLGIGALAGLGAVLAGKNQDVTLPRGTSVEMVLDRDLTYTAEELRR